MYIIITVIHLYIYTFVFLFLTLEWKDPLLIKNITNILWPFKLSKKNMTFLFIIFNLLSNLINQFLINLLSSMHFEYFHSKQAID